MYVSFSMYIFILHIIHSDSVSGTKHCLHIHLKRRQLPKHCVLTDNVKLKYLSIHNKHIYTLNIYQNCQGPHGFDFSGV